MRVTKDEMTAEFVRILTKNGFSQEKALESADIFVQNSLDGIYSHGVNRFPVVVDYIKKGYVKPDAEPTVEISLGAIERWNGNLAMGNITAKHAMARAIELAKQHGIGAVALRNTNHWMRGGYFGWQAANQGCAAICWTNTWPNTPAWGATKAILGNNPFVIAIPRSNGQHVVVDMAMTQFSFGKMEEYSLAGKDLPVEGGYDTKGNLTKNPAEIIKSWRPLTVGYWKGSALSIGLDMFAALVAGGLSTPQIGKNCKEEYSLSQVLMAIDVSRLGTAEERDKMMDETIELIKNTPKEDGVKELRYPAEREFRTRQENLANGIPVDERVWEKIKSL